MKFNNLPPRHRLNWIKALAIGYRTPRALIIYQLKRTNPHVMLRGSQLQASTWLNDEERRRFERDLKAIYN